MTGRAGAGGWSGRLYTALVPSLAPSAALVRRYNTTRLVLTIQRYLAGDQARQPARAALLIDRRRGRERRRVE